MKEATISSPSRIPIEYLHRHKKCIVNQREVNSDTKSFSAALRHILRQDPDIILIGEMRDLETIRGRPDHRRNGTPDLRHPAYQLLRRNDQPDHRCLSSPPATADPDPALLRPGRRLGPAAASEEPAERDGSSPWRS